MESDPFITHPTPLFEKEREPEFVFGSFLSEKRGRRNSYLVPTYRKRERAGILLWFILFEKKGTLAPSLEIKRGLG
jgi:hypothetical protein